MRTIVIACALCLCIGALSGCASNASSSSSSSTTDRTKLVVGFDEDFPPYGYVGDDGQFTGFDLDLASEVAQRNGWTIEYKPINWDAKDLELSSGSIDCIWNGFTIEGREDGYQWTDPYMDNSQVVVVRKDSGITSLSDLAGKTVLAQADSAALHLLQGDQAELASTFKDLKSTPEYNTAFMELQSGAVDAVAIDRPVAKYETAGQDDTYMILDEPLSSEHYGVGCLLGNTSLTETIESTLQDMDSDGTVASICKKYADQGISYDDWILPAK